MDEVSIKETAMKIVNDIACLTGGPYTKDEDAIKLVSTHLREAYRKGWDDKQQQLAQAMYPR